jgi:hypothetical protein
MASSDVRIRGSAYPTAITCFYGVRVKAHADAGNHTNGLHSIFFSALVRAVHQHQSHAHVTYVYIRIHTYMYMYIYIYIYILACCIICTYMCIHTHTSVLGNLTLPAFQRENFGKRKIEAGHRRWCLACLCAIYSSFSLRTIHDAMSDSNFRWVRQFFFAHVFFPCVFFTVCALLYRFFHGVCAMCSYLSWLLLCLQLVFFTAENQSVRRWVTDEYWIPFIGVCFGIVLYCVCNICIRAYNDWLLSFCRVTRGYVHGFVC